jgi:sugar O-acyltransferase (sialic acid O-acetyltransferase NeuD family)
MIKLIIFGTGLTAEVVFNCFSETDDYQVVGFTCDQDYIRADTFLGLPVVPFEYLEEQWSPQDHHCFVALGYQDINIFRANKVAALKDKGYRLASYISPRLEFKRSIKIGENCFIMSGADIQPCVSIGNNTFVWSGALVGHHSIIGDNCWITSSANIAGNVTLGDNCFIAINATIGNDLVIGTQCFIGANALVTKNLLSESVVIESSSKVFRLKTKDFLRMSNFH